MVITGRGLDLEPFDRLEEKVRTLVGYVERLRAEHAEAAAESTRLRLEVEALQTRLAEALDADREVQVLRQERDQVRARVSEMLDQLEAVELAELRR